MSSSVIMLQKIGLLNHLLPIGNYLLCVMEEPLEVNRRDLDNTNCAPSLTKPETVTVFSIFIINRGLVRFRPTYCVLGLTAYSAWA